MKENIETLYSDLRKIKEGEFAIFLGAGSSYDYGIPTMDEMASMLIEELQNNKTGVFFDSKSIEVLSAISGITKSKNGEKKTPQEKTTKWNVEDLLTRLQRILDASENKNSIFPDVTTAIEGKNFSREDISSAEAKLIGFMVNCYQLNSATKTSHGDKSVEYLANFLEFVGDFHNSISIFTTNNDLCVESAIMRLSQMQKNTRKKDFYLVDGFCHGILPTFSISNFTQIPHTTSNRVVVYLWKLHGSVDWMFCNPIKPNSSQPKVENKIPHDNFTDESIICRNIDGESLKKFQDAGAISKEVTFESSKAMIFPTPSKYSQAFNNPYMDLYQAFRRTLEMTEFLLVVGTSFPDGHINSAIKSFLAKDNALMYVVDPCVNNGCICKKLGECDGIQPVISIGFKDFIDELQKVEAAQEEPDSKSGS